MEYLLFPPPGDLPTQVSNSSLPHCRWIVVFCCSFFLIAEPPGKPIEQGREEWEMDLEG